MLCCVFNMAGEFGFIFWICAFRGWFAFALWTCKMYKIHSNHCSSHVACVLRMYIICVTVTVHLRYNDLCTKLWIVFCVFKLFVDLCVHHCTHIGVVVFLNLIFPMGGHTTGCGLLFYDMRKVSVSILPSPLLCCLVCPFFVSTTSTNMCAHVKDPVSICCKRVGLTSGGRKTRKRYTREKKTKREWRCVLWPLAISGGKQPELNQSISYFFVCSHQGDIRQTNKHTQKEEKQSVDFRVQLPLT